MMLLLCTLLQVVDLLVHLQNSLHVAAFLELLQPPSAVAVAMVIVEIHYPKFPITKKRTKTSTWFVEFMLEVSNVIDDPDFN